MQLSEKWLEFSASVISTSPKSFFDSLSAIGGGGINRIHVDVMDGSFVPRFGLYPEFVEEIRSASDLPIDIHMMTDNAEKYVSDFVAAGASRIVPHIETSHHVHRLVQTIIDSGIEAGLALNPHTDVSTLTHVIQDLSVVTVMAINPGIVGHNAIPSSFAKVREVRNFLDGKGFQGSLEVDGGVNFENVGSFQKAGANVLVVGAGTVFHPAESTSKNLSRLNLIRDSLGSTA